MAGTLLKTAPASVGTSAVGKTVVRGMLASAQNSYDILSVNSGTRKVEIDYKDRDSNSRSAAVFNTIAAPLAVLPMRLNMNGHAGLVVLQKGKIEPTFMMFAPTTTLTVTKGVDTNDGTCNGDCSLREALVAANAGAGADLGQHSHDDGTVKVSRVMITPLQPAISTSMTDVTITGTGAANTIIQGSTSSAFAGNMGDKAFGNQSGWIAYNAKCDDNECLPSDLRETMLP